MIASDYDGIRRLKSPGRHIIQQQEFKDGKIIKTTDFIGNFVYENGKPAWHNFDEERVVYYADSTIFAETFFGLKYPVRQVNSYYPFGMNIKELSTNSSSIVHRNEYLYNGKMKQDEMGLGWFQKTNKSLNLTL